MLFRQKPRDLTVNADHGSPSAGGGANLDATKREGDDLLAAGDEAINRALSGDSQGFINATRQRGGQ